MFGAFRNQSPLQQENRLSVVLFGSKYESPFLTEFFRQYSLECGYFFFSWRVSLKGLEAATQNRLRAEGWLSTHGYVKRKRKRKKIKVVFSDSLDTKVGIILLSTNTVVCFQATIQLSFWECQDFLFFKPPFSCHFENVKISRYDLPCGASDESFFSNLVIIF